MTDFIPEQRKSKYDGDYWKHASGEIGWQDGWNASNYAQQIKATGPANAEYDERYNALTKGDSAIDDDGEWRTLKSAKNSEEGTQAEFEALAKEWKAAGYDVRVQDLDNSQGAEWADIAVRKSSNTGEAKPEAPEPPVAFSEKLVTARSRVKQYEEDVLGGRAVYGKSAQEQQQDGTSFLSRYMDKLDSTYQQIEDGRYVNRKDQAKYEIDKAEWDKNYA